MLKNTWLDEVKVRDCARTISNCLAFSFVGKKIDMEAWGEFALNMIRELAKSQRVRDSLMWKYTFNYELDGERVQSLEFVKLPWLV